MNQMILHLILSGTSLRMILKSVVPGLATGSVLAASARHSSKESNESTRGPQPTSVTLTGNGHVHIVGANVHEKRIMYKALIMFHFFVNILEAQRFSRT